MSSAMVLFSQPVRAVDHQIITITTSGLYTDGTGGNDVACDPKKGECTQIDHIDVYATYRSGSGNQYTITGTLSSIDCNDTTYGAWNPLVTGYTFLSGTVAHMPADPADGIPALDVDLSGVTTDSGGNFSLIVTH